MKVQPQLPQIRVKLDWKAYYKKFAEQHGGFPIVYKGRQLFADGWTYSMSDYAGPEWPPPADRKELLVLQTVYWYTRWNRAKNELQLVIQRDKAMKGLQEDKSAPLQQVIIDKDEETGKVVSTIQDWNPKLFAHVIRFLEDEVKQASDHLEALKKEKDALNA